MEKILIKFNEYFKTGKLLKDNCSISNHWISLSYSDGLDIYYIDITYNDFSDKDVNNYYAIDFTSEETSKLEQLHLSTQEEVIEKIEEYIIGTSV